jgi:hypothetical protein
MENNIALHQDIVHISINEESSSEPVSGCFSGLSVAAPHSLSQTQQHPGVSVINHIFLHH